MTAADVRARLTHALRLDLIGPEPHEPQAGEVLAFPPSRWYLTGFLVPWSAPAKQKQDDDDQGDLELTEAAAQGDEDNTTAEPPAARRGHFPSSLRISLLLPVDATELRVTARWGDYTPKEVGAKPKVEWHRQERLETVTVRLGVARAEPSVAPVPESRGLEVMTSVRRIRRLEDLPGCRPGRGRFRSFW